jgi:hypothetical protein
MKKTKLPFDHVVKYDTKEVWVKCDSAITAMGIGAYCKAILSWILILTLRSEDYLNELRNQQVQS